MRHRSVVLLMALASLGALGIARAEVLRFQGDAQIVMHEVLTHGDWYDVDVQPVEIQIELTGPRAVTFYAYAAGSATIARADGSVVTVPLQGTMSPPEGGGGAVFVSGVGDDAALYCFRIVDQVDAPGGPRADRVVAAFEPLDRIVAGHVQDNLALLPGGQIRSFPTDNCSALDGRYASPISGDFWFTTLL